MSADTIGIMLFRKWRKSGVLDVAQAQGTAAGRGVGSVLGVLVNAPKALGAQYRARVQRCDEIFN
jgi:hypothetical protein